MKIKFEDDKRTAAYFQSGKTSFVESFNLYNHKENGIEAPLMILSPNIVALLLSISENAFQESKVIFDTKLEPFAKLVTNSDKSSYYHFECENNCTLVFDMIEQLFVAFVFGYSAVEALVNSLIPNDYEHAIETKKHGRVKKEITKKPYIERCYNLEDKLNLVLAEIYQYEQNTYKKNKEDIQVWNEFKELMKNRNNIIHPKSDFETHVFLKQVKFIADVFYDGLEKKVIKSTRGLIENICSKVYKCSLQNISPYIPLEFRKGMHTIEDYEKF